MEQFKPNKQEGNESKEGLSHGTLAAAAMFLSVLAADPAFAQDQNNTPNHNPNIQQIANPKDFFKTFATGVMNKLHEDGTDTQIAGAAQQFLSILATEGSKALQQKANELNALGEQLRQQQRNQ